MSDKAENYCEHHKPVFMGYIQQHDWATKRISQKLTQVFCPNCKHYLFPDELNELHNIKAVKAVEKHKAYLELHPRAKSTYNF